MLKNMQMKATGGFEQGPVDEPRDPQLDHRGKVGKNLRLVTPPLSLPALLRRFLASSFYLLSSRMLLSALP